MECGVDARADYDDRPDDDKDQPSQHRESPSDWRAMIALALGARKEGLAAEPIAQTLMLGNRVS